jgi:hypothetical protein
VPLGVMTSSEGAAADRLLAPPSHLLLGCRISGGEDDGTSDQASDRSEGEF